MKKQAAAKKTTTSKAAAKKRATPATAGATAKTTKAPRRAPSPAATPRPAREHVHDVVVVGAGPSGSSCAYWLADAGWDVVVVEKKRFPREKTCGDGLTPRAVRQLADMDLEGALAGSHRYSGLRAFGFGRSIDMRWPQHPNFPDYGYTITRHDLDGLVAHHAEQAGATLLQGTEVTAPVIDEGAPLAGALPTLTGVTVKEKGADSTRIIKARYVVVADGSNSRAGPDARHVPPQGPAHGHGPARLLPIRAARRSLH